MQYENFFRASVTGVPVGNWIAGATYCLLSLEICVCLFMWRQRGLKICMQYFSRV